MFVFAFIVSFVAIAAIIAPLVLGQGGRLASASSLNSPERLLATKKAILLRYLEDERFFEAKKITRLTWDQRKQYLSNRYIDAARRLDYIEDLIAVQKAKGDAAHG
ncbi:MAG: hypothetical protein H7249_15170 [Chitinophagaceae bacterium]|nr:hypothetical protein [Oligoflexus sp.]